MSNNERTHIHYAGLVFAVINRIEPETSVELLGAIDGT